jgi:hypothetical protein
VRPARLSSSTRYGWPAHGDRSADGPRALDGVLVLLIGYGAPAHRVLRAEELDTFRRALDWKDIEGDLDNEGHRWTANAQKTT